MLRRISVLSATLSSTIVDSSTGSVPITAEGRLRRHSTRPIPYKAGETVTVVKVPQVAAGVDFGHVSLLIGQPGRGGYDTSMASVGFYSKNYRRGLLAPTTMVGGEEGVLLSPDPLYVKAARSESTRDKIVVLYRGSLSELQAKQLNAWTDDSGGADAPLQLSELPNRRERATVRLDDERYVGLAFVRGGANCATWIERFVPNAISCPMGVPRFCRKLDEAERAKSLVK